MWQTAPTTKFDSKAWLRLIIQPIFTNCLDLWMIQNNKRHGTDDQAKKSLCVAQVGRNLQALYLMQPRVLAAGCNLFHDSVEDRLTHAIYTIQQWVLLHYQIIRCSRNQARHGSTHTLMAGCKLWGAPLGLWTCWHASWCYCRTELT